MKKRIGSMKKRIGFLALGMWSLLPLSGFSEGVTRHWTGLGADAKASTAENWLTDLADPTSVGAPQSGDAVMFAGDADATSPANKTVTWDLDVTLASWDQSAYTNTVTVSSSLANFGTTGDCFLGTNTTMTTILALNSPMTVGGDMILANKAKVTATTSTRALTLTVNGDLSVAAGTSITADTCGYRDGYQWRYSHGGHAVDKTKQGAVVEVTQDCFGSLTKPTTAGGGNYVDVKNISTGGGVVRLVVGGALALNGNVSANGNTVGWNYATGAGGSVWITAKSLAGAGTIRANAGGTTRENASALYRAGGGRIAVYLTGAGEDFAAFTGTVSAWGDGDKSVVYAGAGTIYLKTGDQADNEGTLVIDNFASTYKSVRATEISPYVTDADVGSVVIRNGGWLRLLGDQSLKVRGSWLKSGDFTAEAGSTVTFAGTSTAVISGNTSFARLVCETPGKTLQVAPGTELSVSQYFGAEGTSGHPVTFASTTAGEMWYMTLADGAVQKVEYVSVSDSSAANGAEIVALNSTLTDTVNWRNVQVTPGAVNTWTGGAGSSNWGTAGNWSQGRVPASTDRIVIGTAANAPVVAADFSCQELSVASGARLNAGAYAISVSDAFTCAGTLAFAGEGRLSVAGSVSVTGAVEPSQSTLVLYGAASQSVTSTGATFHNVSSTCPSVTLSGRFVCDAFSTGDGTAARSLLFAEDATLVATVLNVVGNAATTNAVLGPVVAGKTWKLETMKATVVGATVTGSDARGGACVVPTDCKDGGDNQNWLFDDTRVTWSSGTIPSDADVVATGADLKISAAASVRSLSVASGAKVTVSKVFEVAGDVTVEDGGTLVWDVPGTVGGSLIVLSGGTLTHTANSKTDAYAIHLTIGGNVFVAAGGSVDVIGKGYTSTSCPWGTSYGGAGGHGSYSGSYQGCYGSVLCPTNSGSTAFRGSPGAGIVWLACAGTITVDGDMIANGKANDGYQSGGSGAGGSICLRASSVKGAGRITANGGVSTGNNYAGGGRVAVRLTTATALDFVGTLSAYGGNAGTAYSSAGTVYLETAADAPSAGTISVDNPMTAQTIKAGYTSFPVSAGCADVNETRMCRLVLGHRVKVNVERDCRLADLDVSDTTSTLVLNGHTIRVRALRPSYWPKTGVPSNVTTGTGGQVLWRKEGLVIVVR